MATSDNMPIYVVVDQTNMDVIDPLRVVGAYDLVVCILWISSKLAYLHSFCSVLEKIKKSYDFRSLRQKYLWSRNSIFLDWKVY